MVTTARGLREIMLKCMYRFFLVRIAQFSVLWLANFTTLIADSTIGVVQICTPSYHPFSPLLCHFFPSLYLGCRKVNRLSLVVVQWMPIIRAVLSSFVLIWTIWFALPNVPLSTGPQVNQLRPCSFPLLVHKLSVYRIWALDAVWPQMGIPARMIWSLLSLSFPLWIH